MAVVDVTGRPSDEETAAALLAAEGVLVHPGYFYDFEEEGVLVLSLLTPEADFAQGLERILASLARPGGPLTLEDR